MMVVESTIYYGNDSTEINSVGLNPLNLNPG